MICCGRHPAASCPQPKGRRRRAISQFRGSTPWSRNQAAKASLAWLCGCGPSRKDGRAWRQLLRRQRGRSAMQPAITDDHDLDVVETRRGRGRASGEHVARVKRAAGRARSAPRRGGTKPSNPRLPHGSTTSRQRGADNRIPDVHGCDDVTLFDACVPGWASGTVFGAMTHAKERAACDTRGGFMRETEPTSGTGA